MTGQAKLDCPVATRSARIQQQLLDTSGAKFYDRNKNSVIESMKASQCEKCVTTKQSTQNVT